MQEQFFHLDSKVTSATRKEKKKSEPQLQNNMCIKNISYKWWLQSGSVYERSSSMTWAHANDIKTHPGLAFSLIAVPQYLEWLPVLVHANLC